jgi:hypothetical protein
MDHCHGAVDGGGAYLHVHADERECDGHTRPEGLSLRPACHDTSHEHTVHGHGVLDRDFSRSRSYSGAPVFAMVPYTDAGQEARLVTVPATDTALTIPHDPLCAVPTLRGPPVG